MNATNVKVVRKVYKDGSVEPFEFMMKRFKKSYQESGLLADIRRNEFAMSKGQRKAEKRKRAAEVRRREEIRNSKYYVKEEEE